MGKIRSWHGPGALANILLRECGASEARKGDFSWDVYSENLDSPETLQQLIAERLSVAVSAEEVASIFRHNGARYNDYFRRMAYFGGRIEAFKRGEFDTVYNYDLTNAYGYAITK